MVDLGVRGGDRELIARMAATIMDALRPLVVPGTPCAVLDFPSYANVGDSLIWLGQREALRRLGARVVYMCDMDTYAAGYMRMRLGDGLILLTGGGNFGDLWAHHQRFRERVVADFPHHRIIQLPQTVYFMDERTAARTRAVLAGHRDFTMLVRDPGSLAYARDVLGVRAVLCPDVVFMLGPVRRPAPPREDVLVLARQDAEVRSPLGRLAAHGVTVTDWATDDRTPIRQTHVALTRCVIHYPRALPAVGAMLWRTYDPLARQRMERGARLLARGRVVITDRLHGHLLCVLMGIPHVLLPNSYAKNRAYYDAWTRSSPLATWADEPEQAIALARGMLAAAS
ncbi:MAG: polysaccharide pyruvyl transferase family protein [Armatimonadota bacterium]|nr:polysaccharide pyruvyl transferase family protein [Armatimonadota bacterium]